MAAPGPTLLLLLLLGTGSSPSPPSSSCAGRCGEGGAGGGCGCGGGCAGLGSCCADLWLSCPEAWPHFGTLLGGKVFALGNISLSGVAAHQARVLCRFGGAVVTEGFVSSSPSGGGGVRCVSPLLLGLGRVSLEVSPDGGRSFPWTSAWTAEHHNKVPPGEKSVLENETRWQYYGTPGTQAGNLTLTWRPQDLGGPSAPPRVNIEVWGYAETGKPYSANWAAKWEYLYSLQRNQTNSGIFTFLPEPSAQHGHWELGALRISSSTSLEGQRNVPAIWSNEHAMAWHLGGGFRKDPAAWATAKCHEWDRLEMALPSFLEEIVDCPCTLAQARADTGRFHTDYGCDIEKGSVCTYHPGAVHCVRGIQASPRYAAGQQCCYDATGVQVLTGDSMGGSTPDRGHDWGSPPYQKPPRVPGFSHWIYDVLSFYYCCLWSQNCPVYFQHRPSSGCQKYHPPRAASAFGDPHFITFDGMNFTFKGLGEYTLLESDLTLLTVQGRTRPARSPNGTEGAAPNVTGLCAIAMRENASDVVEVRLPEASEELEVLLNQKTLNLSEQTWMDLNGLFLSVSPGDERGVGVTAMFSSGAGVEVRGGRALSVTVLMPEAFVGRTQGLFGTLNGDPRDDLAFRNGTVLDPAASPEQILAFGAHWSVRNESALFTYDSVGLREAFLWGPKHHASFVPYVPPPEDPADPFAQAVAALCHSDPFCRFDALAARDLAAGNTTQQAHFTFRRLQDSLQPVVSCGWLSAPEHGAKNGTNYLAGATVHFRCEPGFHLEGTPTRLCQQDGMWTGSAPRCTSAAGFTGPLPSALWLLSLALCLGVLS
nr:sushi domain-containing protein 2 [Anolis sagrei ordinatus]